jgi:asparagine synthase (glutamine-hydrolysing)
MCGIAALFATNGPKRALDPVAPMTDMIRHRGPDDEGRVWIRPSGEAGAAGGRDTPSGMLRAGYPWSPEDRADKCPEDAIVVLGHRRLAIRDVSPAAHQPLCDPGMRYWVVFDGEIYNSDEVRRDLEDLGHRFFGTVDTELIPAAYAEWGSACLDRLSGMWAFVLYDTATGSVFASRDRFGIKPLYYWRTPRGALAFASEIKQFTALPGWEARLNPERAWDFLMTGVTDHTAETLFSGVYQVRGGEYIEAAIGDLAEEVPVRRWYAPAPAHFNGSFEDGVAAFRGRLCRVVEEHLQSVGKIGACLSGGLDSSSIVRCTQLVRSGRESGEPLRTYSSLSDVEEYNEEAYIREVIACGGTEPAWLHPTPEGLARDLDTLVWHQDEPFGSTRPYMQWVIFQRAHLDGVRVMLDGQGADEHLCGYIQFFGWRYAGLFRSLRWLTLIRELLAGRHIQGHRVLTSLGMACYHGSTESTRRRLQSWKLRRGMRTPWFDSGRLGIGRDSAPPLYVPPGNSMDAYAVGMLTESRLPQLLHWGDRDSTAHSVEVRLPFLDPRLVELDLGLPEEYKLSGGRTKLILRESMAGILPETVRLRRGKMMMGIAEDHWMRTTHPELFRALLEESIRDAQGVLTPEALAKFEEYCKGNDLYHAVAWRGICFGRWMRLFKVALPGTPAKKEAINRG